MYLSNRSGIGSWTPQQTTLPSNNQSMFAAEFFMTVTGIANAKPPLTPDSSPMEVSNVLCWLSCVQTAGAELALSCSVPAPLDSLTGIVTEAFSAVSCTLGKQSKAAGEPGAHVVVEPVAWLCCLAPVQWQDGA